MFLGCKSVENSLQPFNYYLKVLRNGKIYKIKV